MRDETPSRLLTQPPFPFQGEGEIAECGYLSMNAVSCGEMEARVKELDRRSS